MSTEPFDRVWRWRTTGLGRERVEHPLADRAGEPCRVLARAVRSPRNVLVEFPDGHRVVAPLFAVRRAPTGAEE